MVFVLLSPVLVVEAQSQQRYSIERYLNIRWASRPTFSPDGEQLAFLTNITGVAQVWRIDALGGWPDQLTFFEDRVRFVKWSPTEDLLVFGKDVGGNERTQLYLMPSTGESITDLSSYPEAIHSFGGWSHDGEWIAFASNRRDPAFFDVYIQNIRTGEVRLVYQQDGSNFVSGWSPDDRYLIIWRFNSSFDQDLFLLELESQNVVHLTPHEGLVRYSGINWTPDSKGIYLITDRDRDFMNLAHIDLRSRKLTYLEDTDWDVEGLVVSEDGRFMAYVLNVDGYSELKIKDLETEQTLPTPPLPKGIVARLTFSPDGMKLAFTITGPRHNADVWVWELDKRRLVQVTHSSRAGIPQETFVEPMLVHYETFDGRRIPAFFYLPKGAEESDRVPAIVHIHGGPEAQERVWFNPIFQYFLHRGYAIFSPNVRGSTGYGKAYTHLDDVRLREDSVKDIAYAVRYLKASGYVNPGKIAVMGASYGGYMVLAALTKYPDLWAAGVDIVGIANFKTFLQNTGPYRRKWRIAEYGDPVKDGDFLEKISPIHHVEKIKAPLMVIHGANDPRVPRSEADQIVEEIRRRNGVVEYLLFQDEGHGIAKLHNRIKAYTQVADFLDRYLR
ncbi:MAG TPA: S9 family peptidase [Candidatus Latescibacteria bacterium]|nr:S9 family peptidase [Candidatus Latescibacterota bacterium]